MRDAYCDSSDGTRNSAQAPHPGSVKRRGRRERRGRAEQRRAVDREAASLPKDSPRPPRFHSGPSPAGKLPLRHEEHVRPRDNTGPPPGSLGSGAATACMASAEIHPVRRSPAGDPREQSPSASRTRAVDSAKTPLGRSTGSRYLSRCQFPPWRGLFCALP